MSKIKHVVFKLIIVLWKLMPRKFLAANVLKKFPVIKRKLYKDLRYKGEMEIHAKGKTFRMYNPGNTTIENELFWNGLENGWEKVSLKIWSDIAENQETILDIGANSGIYSLVAAAVNCKAEVYAFEPVHRTRKLLKRNLELNQDLKINVIDKAVSNRFSRAPFYDIAIEPQYSASLNENMLANHPNRITYEVETIALDDFTVLKNKRIGLIKLDIEMHEPEAIEGMLGLIKKNRPILLVEILNKSIGTRLQHLFSDLNYSYFNIDEINPPRRVENLSAIDHYNFLFVPGEKDLSYTLEHK